MLARCCHGLSLGASQPAFRKAMLLALPAAGIAFAMKFFEQRFDLEYKVSEDNTYQSFTFLLSFFVVLHTSHAYQRLMQGAESLYTIMGDLVDLSSLLLAFTRVSSAEAEQVHHFRLTIIRLMSLLFSVSVAELEDGDGDDRRAHDFPLLDVAGLDAAILQRVVADEHKPEVICHITQSLIVDSISSGVLTIPAPLLTRAFQELGAAMIKFHEVRAYKEVTFPFPLKAASTFLLAIHWLITPAFMVDWTPTPHGAAFYTFLSVFTLWTLHCVAVELDNPFGTDMNDLSMDKMQEDFNSRLKSLVFQSVADTDLSSDMQRSMDRCQRSESRKSTDMSFKEMNEWTKSGQLPSSPRDVSESFSNEGGAPPESNPDGAVQHETFVAEPVESAATAVTCEDWHAEIGADVSEVAAGLDPQVADQTVADAPDSEPDSPGGGCGRYCIGRSSGSGGDGVGTSVAARERRSMSAAPPDSPTTRATHRKAEPSGQASLAGCAPPSKAGHTATPTAERRAAAPERAEWTPSSGGGGGRAGANSPMAAPEVQRATQASI